MLDLSEVMQIAQLDRPELKDEPWRPITQARLQAAHGDDELFAEIRRADVFVHHPYESFAATVERFIGAASRDPAVRALKTTVYRTSEESPVVPALVRATEQGKQSVCLVELKARFDEGRNIEQAHMLEQAGVHVAYGFPDLKVHAKTTLVVRREGDRLRRYVHIGTGNYHSVTARLYEDVGIFTADEDIAADVADLFNYLTGFGRPGRFRKLLVAPVALRGRLVALIRQVAVAAAEGKRAEIKLKVNALTDPGIIDELLAAADAGARIDIIARSICMLRPVNERITVRSVLGRFLEHSRILVFHAGTSSDYLIGQRRPHAPQSRPPHRDRRADRVAAGTGRDQHDLRHAARRQPPGLAARRRRNVDAAAAGRRREAEGRPDRAHAARPDAGAAPGRVPQPCEVVVSSAAGFVRPAQREESETCA